MNKNKCVRCGKKAASISWKTINRNTSNPGVVPEPLCEVCSFRETWLHSKECLETYLDSFVERLNKYQSLSKKELDFLKVVKKEMPKMVEEFPVLFNELNKD